MASSTHRSSFADASPASSQIARTQLWLAAATGSKPQSSQTSTEALHRTKTCSPRESPDGPLVADPKRKDIITKENVSPTRSTSYYTPAAGSQNQGATVSSPRPGKRQNSLVSVSNQIARMYSFLGAPRDELNSYTADDTPGDERPFDTTWGRNVPSPSLASPSFSRASAEVLSSSRSQSPHVVITGHDSHPLKRMFRSFSINRQAKNLVPRKERWSLDDDGEDGNTGGRKKDGRSDRTQSVGGESKPPMGWIGSIRSATAAIASSIGSGQHDRSSRFSIARLSNRRSDTASTRNKTSFDDGRRSSSPANAAAMLRSKRRKEIVEELMISEESYINDLRALTLVRHDRPL